MSSKGTLTSVPGRPGDGPPSTTYTYTEGDRTFVATWEARDDGSTLYLYTAKWSNGDPIDDEARARIHEAFLETTGPLVDEYFQPPRRLR